MRARCAGRSTSGFALMIALVLLGFILLLLVSLTALTQTELTNSVSKTEQAIARQNALLGLQTALGQLQQHAGADQRITAAADLQPVPRGSDTDPASGQSLKGKDPQQTLAAIDKFWQDGGRQRHWTGVWKDPDPTRSEYDPESADKSVPVPELIGWLVSGNEKDGNTFTPQDTIRALSAEDLRAPQRAIRTANGKTAYRIVLGTGTVNVGAAEELDRVVIVPEVPVFAEGSATDKTGSYAYWIGDEGIKTHIAVTDPYARHFPNENARKRLLSAQRPAAAAHAAALEPLEDLLDYQSGRALIDAIGSAFELDHLRMLVPADDAFATELKNRYHQLTLHSMGILSDTRHGGLRHDLSMLLGQPDLNTFNTHLAKVYKLDPAADLPAHKPILLTRKAATNNTAAVPTIYAKYPSHFSGAAADKKNYERLLDYSATWGQLYSHYNMGKNVSEGGAMRTMPASEEGGAATTSALSRPHTATQSGIGPLITQAKLFFGMEIDGSGQVIFKLRPLVVLTNPYNVPVTGTWWVKMEPTKQLQLSYPRAPTDAETEAGTMPVVDPDKPDPKVFNDNYNIPSNKNTRPSIGKRMLLKIPEMTLQPGQAYVFTLDKNETDSGNYLDPVPELTLVNDFDETTTFTFPTADYVDASKQYVALYATGSQLLAELHTGPLPPPTGGAEDENLLHYVYAKGAGNFTSLDAFLVYPMPTTAGSRSGGGMWATVNDAFFPNPQQAPFLHVNYLARVIHYTGFTTPNDHPLEWAQTYFRDGKATNANNGFKEDVVFAPESTTQVHWGLANNGKTGATTTHPVGKTDAVSILYEIPDATILPNSLGQLQHFNTTGFIKEGERWDSTGDFSKQYATVAASMQNNYLISNSYPNVRVGRHQLMNSKGTTSGEGSIGPHYDGSWLMNEVLWDRFFFSSYPASGSFSFGTDKLLNHRYQPLRRGSGSGWDTPANFRATSTSAARNLGTQGAFNINSTSPEAWRALLTYAKGISMRSANTDTSVHVPFSRFSYPASDHNNSRDGVSQNAWGGFHNFSEAEIDELAHHIAMQVRRRGPFTSLSDFVNRRLIKTNDDKLDTGLSGALQSALDEVINKKENVTASGLKASYISRGSSNGIAENSFLPQTRTAGSPSHVLQADLLAPLAPVLSARSDTFVIRAYGSAAVRGSGNAGSSSNGSDARTAHAWCEALVQRLPDYVDASNSPEASGDDLSAINENFGRKFRVISFRWLSPEDV